VGVAHFSMRAILIYQTSRILAQNRFGCKVGKEYFRIFSK
jgi:hypothetical protein